jgi:hypothetical protein
MTGSIKTDNTQVILNLQAKILSLQAAIKVKDEALQEVISLQKKHYGDGSSLHFNMIHWERKYGKSLSLPTDNLMLEEVGRFAHLAISKRVASRTKNLSPDTKLYVIRSKP